MQEFLTDTTLAEKLLLISSSVLVIYIPLAIELLKEQGLARRIVIFDYVFNKYGFCTAFILLFVSPLLLNLKELPLHLPVALWLIGVAIAFWGIARAYSWFTGDQTKITLKYLAGRKTTEKHIAAWSELLGSDSNVIAKGERDFLNQYIKTVEVLFSSIPNRLNDIRSLLTTMTQFAQSTNLVYLTAPKSLVENLFKWRLELWTREQQALFTDGNKNSVADYFTAINAIDELLAVIMRRSFEEHHPFGFFYSLKEHLDQIKGYDIPVKESDTRHYASTLLPGLYTIFFQYMHDSPNRYEIWNHYFPESLLVTSKNIETDHRKLAEESFKSFLEWARDRVLNTREYNKFDSALEDVSQNLFPETNPALWSVLIILFFHSHEPEWIIKHLIENGRTFGLSGRLMSWSGDKTDEEVAQIWKDTESSQIEDTLTLFFKFNVSGVFFTDFLDKCIKTTTDYIVEEDPERHKEARKAQILSYLRIIKKRVESMRKEHETK